MGHKMTDTSSGKMARIQSAVDRLAEAEPGDQEGALNHLAICILQHFGEGGDSNAITKLFSPELPRDVQRFAAVWLLRLLTESSHALDFGSMNARAGSLSDRAFERDLYQTLGVDAGRQTFEKIPELVEHTRSVIERADALIDDIRGLDRLTPLQQNLQKLIHDKGSRPILLPLLPRSIANRDRIAALFRDVGNYAENSDGDPIARRDAAVSACDEYEREADAYGTKDARRILGGMARQLRSAVTTHFDSLEAAKAPQLRFSSIDKKYPLEQRDAQIAFKVRIENLGPGHARDVKLEEADSDPSLRLKTEATALGTLEAEGSFVLDIVGTVVTPSTDVDLVAMFSWSRLGERIEKICDFQVKAQRADVDWVSVELQEPYSLEAITSGEDLIGRKAELRRLLRRANSPAVGSGFISGQKRVGKTSLANAVAERLESNPDMDWIVIKKGSGGYIGSDAASTLKALGNVLVQEMKHRIPGIAEIPLPDFSGGLAPLSSFVDAVLRQNSTRLLFVLDEFDELPIELLRRTPVGTSLFQPIREISSKRGCGFLLIGGESMQQIMTSQGDRLNKFGATRLDYFDKSSDWSDFAELIRKPVQNWLSISDAALAVLFKCSAGNPYFAKLLASQLAADMVNQRSSDASEADMDDAIDNSLKSTVGANSFAHFWLDGIPEDADDAEARSMQRRSVLIAVGHALRNRDALNSDVILDEFKNPADPNWREGHFQQALRDFIRRGILVEGEKGELSAKIPLFKSWLTDNGVGELLADFGEQDYLSKRLQREESERVNDQEVLAVSEGLGHFRGRRVETSAIRRWLDQFDTPSDRRLMFKVLSNVRIYSEDAIRSKMHEAFGIVARDMFTKVEPRARVRKDILVSYLDESPAKAGSTYCRLFASENNLSAQSVLTLETLKRRMKGDGQIQRLVLIDDFAGTGRSLVNGLKRELDTLQSANVEGIRVILIALVGFGSARTSVERFIKSNDLDARVCFCEELGDEDRAFHETSRAFPDRREREHARQIAEAKGVNLEKWQPLGFRGDQALIVFSQSCPNNTLPILWSRNKDWSPLFPRN